MVCFLKNVKEKTKGSVNMPNWAQGSMRVRGEKKQVEKFIKEGIEYNNQFYLM